MPTMRDNWLRIKLILKRSNRKYFYSAVEVAVAHFRSKLMCMAWCTGLFWIWTNNNIRKNSYFITTSGYCPPSWILSTRSYTNMIVLQSAVNAATVEVLCNAPMATKAQLSVCGD